MKKKFALTSEQRLLLEKLNNDQLIFLQGVKDHKNFDVFIGVMNYLNNYEKNSFFLENEEKLTPDALYAKHAYARGGMEKLSTLRNVMSGSSQELERRESERKKEAK